MEKIDMGTVKILLYLQYIFYTMKILGLLFYIYINKYIYVYDKNSYLIKNSY